MALYAEAHIKNPPKHERYSQNGTVGISDHTVIVTPKVLKHLKPNQFISASKCTNNKLHLMQYLLQQKQT